MLLLILLFICHWLGDYTHLSRPFMLQAKATGKPLFPILIHATVHAVLMSLVVLFMFDAVTAIEVYMFQLSTHFAIDVLKGRLNGWFPSLKDNTKYPHWYVFGLDQMLHQIVIVVICFVIAN